MRKVLIVSYYFPPINMIAAKRYGYMCKYFEENNYKAYILTTNHNRRRDENTRMELELPVNEKQIIRIGQDKTNGMVKSLFGNYFIKLLSDWKYDSRTVTSNALGWYEKVKEKINIEELQNIDIIIGTFPPMENLFVAYYLSKKIKCPYIADIRDLISDYSETNEGYKRTKFLDGIIEKYILNKANGIIAVTPGFKNILKTRFPGKKIKVIFNGWDGKENITYERCMEKYLYYAGSLYLHRLESFKLVAKCLKKINGNAEKKIKFVIRSIGPKELDIQIKKWIQQEKMQEYVIFLESSSESIVKMEQRKAYINVVLSSIHEEDSALMTTIPGKVYELLNESKPILAVAPSNSDIGKILRYTYKGIASISEKQIIDFILHTNKTYIGNSKIDFFSRRKQAQQLCRFMDEVLKL